MHLVHRDSRDSIRGASNSRNTATVRTLATAEMPPLAGMLATGEGTLWKRCQQKGDQQKQGHQPQQDGGSRGNVRNSKKAAQKGHQKHYRDATNCRHSQNRNLRRYQTPTARTPETFLNPALDLMMFQRLKPGPTLWCYPFRILCLTSDGTVSNPGMQKGFVKISKLHGFYNLTKVV
jgi:hypothetical protein